MEDADGLSFDFEGGLDSGPAQPTASVPVAAPENTSSAAINVAPSYDHSAASVAGAGRGRSFRQTVCRHWLRGLCMKGDVCGFLHQFDKARMPICRFFRVHGECREPDCNYKHTNEDVKECNMYVHKPLLFVSNSTFLLYAMYEMLLILFFLLADDDVLRLYFAGISWDFVPMVLSVGIGMPSFLDLHLQLRKFFRRYSN